MSVPPTCLRLASLSASLPEVSPLLLQNWVPQAFKRASLSLEQVHREMDQKGPSGQLVCIIFHLHHISTQCFLLQVQVFGSAWALRVHRGEFQLQRPRHLSFRMWVLKLASFAPRRGPRAPLPLQYPSVKENLLSPMIVSPVAPDPLPPPRPAARAPHLQEVPALTVDGDQVIADGDELLGLADEERSTVQLWPVGGEGELALEAQHVQAAWWGVGGGGRGPEMQPPRRRPQAAPLQAHSLVCNAGPLLSVAPSLCPPGARHPSHHRAPCRRDL